MLHDPTSGHGKSEHYDEAYPDTKHARHAFDAISLLVQSFLLRQQCTEGLSALGSVPGVISYAYLGSVSRTEVAAALHHDWSVFQIGLWAAGIIVAVVLLAEFVKPWRRRAPLRALEPDGESEQR